MADTEHASTLAASRYATESRALLQLVQDIRASGGQAVVDLPRVVVIGNQSAGKSSVVEAISGITVPRDSGTCTRCPMECRLKHSPGPWSCQVSIRWEYDDDQKHVDHVSEVSFGDPITNKRDVELMLRRAQAAVLNPKVDANKILEMSAERLEKGVKSDFKPLLFSKNVVCVDLQGPELVDLAFIDLPGIIQIADEMSLVDLVQSMVETHIKGNSLILLTLPMTDDIDNQKAVALARAADPEGERTIGVLTKPDVIGKGSKSRGLFLDIIEGRKNHLRHGYYCTRRPDDDERTKDLTAERAGVIETEFFRSTAPWSTSPHQHRFGIKNIVNSLSILLQQVIKQTLPKISADTLDHLNACNEELSKLPKPLDTEPAMFMLNLLTQFCNDAKQHLEGHISPDSGPESASKLVQTNRLLFTTFRDNVRGTCPIFLPRLRDTVARRSQTSDSSSADALLYPMYLDDMKKHIQSSVARELPNNVPYSAKVDLILLYQQTWADHVNSCLLGVRANITETILECVKQHFERWDGLHALVRNLVGDLVEKHCYNCRSFVEAILDAERIPFTQNEHYLQASEDKWLTQYRDKRAGQKTAEKHKGLTAESSAVPATKDARALQAPPVSNGAVTTPGRPGGSALAQFGQSGFSSQKTQPTPAPTAQSPGTVENLKKLEELVAFINSSGLGFEVTAEDMAKLYPADEYETELKVMAEVRGYFKVSYKRVIDMVPMLIDSKLVHGIMKDIQSFLLDRMKLGASREAAERCARYLAEDPNIVSRRQELLSRKARLEQVRDKLYNFGI